MTTTLRLVMLRIALLGLSWTTALAQNVFYVHGGNPGNATGFFASDDDTPGIQAAIDAARAFIAQTGQVATVEFEPFGTYHLVSTTVGDVALFVNQCTAGTLRFEGKNATLVHRPLLGQSLAIRDSARVEVHELFFDRDPKPFMQGIVEFVHATGEVDVRYHQGLAPELMPPPDPNASPPIRHWGWLLDPSVPGRPKQGTASYYLAPPPINLTPTQNPPLYQFTIGAPASSDFAVGDRWTWHYREGGNNIHIRNSKEITIHRCVSYAAGSMFVNADNCHQLDIVGCDVSIQAGWWRSLNGDGLHIKRSTDVVIDSCTIRGNSDDGINLSEVDFFTVSNCLFENKRRHAIVLDTDDGGGASPPNSTFGAIFNNIAEYNGGAFVSHQGGDYNTVSILGNTPMWNNRTKAAGRNFYVQLESIGAPLLASAEIGPTGVWSPSDPAIAKTLLPQTDRRWHWQYLDQTRGLLVHRAARDTMKWLYLGSEHPSPVAGDQAKLRPPTGQWNPDENIWFLEPIAGTQHVRLRLYAAQVTPPAQLYLTLTPVGATPVRGDPLTLQPLDPSNRLQIWRWSLIED